MKVRRMWTVLVFPLLLGMQAKAEDGEKANTMALMERLIASPEFWDLSHDEFMESYGSLGFRWNSVTKRSARADGKRIPLGAYDKRVGETIVLFEEGSPKQLQVSFYARGDDGQISEDQYVNLLQFWKDTLTEAIGVEGERRGRDNDSAVRADGYQWETEKTAYLLEFSARKRPFRSEFIRLRTAEIVKMGFLEKRLAEEERTTRSDLPANVVRKDGDVFIRGVPMVDQGDKGYCVVASAARVFGYYDMQVDQHEIAQIANSTADGGTSSVGMIEALDRVAGRFKVRVKTHLAMDYDDMEDLTEDYNRLARRAGKREFSEDEYGTNLWNHFDRFDPELLKETRLRRKSGIKRFRSEIERSIDEGVPLLWTVTVGIYPEPKRISQTRGGHMRMIIGYNWDKEEIIFSDSWGAGHEFKRWGVEEAFCSTKGLYSVLPIL